MTNFNKSFEKLAPAVVLVAALGATAGCSEHSGKKEASTSHHSLAPNPILDKVRSDYQRIQQRKQRQKQQEKQEKKRQEAARLVSARPLVDETTRKLGRQCYFVAKYGKPIVNADKRFTADVPEDDITLHIQYGVEVQEAIFADEAAVKDANCESLHDFTFPDISPGLLEYMESPRNTANVRQATDGYRNELSITRVSSNSGASPEYDVAVDSPFNSLERQPVTIGGSDHSMITKSDFAAAYWMIKGYHVELGVGD
jgi:hypothetical protein